MSTTLPLDKYEDLVRRSGLVDASALDRVLSESRGQNDAGVSALANRLMRANLITAWQNDKLLQGKSRGFFLGKYKLLSHLTKGGMSDVFLAESAEYKRVALKIFPPHLIEQASYLERFKQEARTQSEMDHPNIVKALDFGQEGRIYFYVMEFVDGLDLNRLVEMKGPLPYRTAVEFMLQATEALGYAHKQGMVHRDIKPANLMQDADGRIKLLDLGLARVATADDVGSLTIKHNENSLGTADYVAPEQAIDSHNVDERADVYSLGGTLYYLLMGHPPFPDGTPVQRMMAHMNQDPAPVRTKRPDCPDALQAIITKMMCKRPDDRYATMADVRDALNAWLKTAPPAPAKTSAPKAAAGGPAKASDVKAPAKPGDSRLADLKIAPRPSETKPAPPKPAAADPKAGAAPPKSGGSQPIPAAANATAAKPQPEPKTPPGTVRPAPAAATASKPQPEANTPGGGVRPAQAPAAARPQPEANTPSGTARPAQGQAAAPRPAGAAAAGNAAPRTAPAQVSAAAAGGSAPARTSSNAASAAVMTPVGGSPVVHTPAAGTPAVSAPARNAPPPAAPSASESYLSFNTGDSTEDAQASYSSVSDSSEDQNEVSQDSPSELVRRGKPAGLTGSAVALEFSYAMVLGLTAALVPVALKQLQSNPAVVGVCGLMLGAAFTLLRFAFMLNVKR